MKFIQLFLVALLLLCSLDIPYGYYNIIRLVAMAVFTYMAFIFAEEKTWTYGHVWRFSSAVSILYEKKYLYSDVKYSRCYRCNLTYSSDNYTY